MKHREDRTEIGMCGRMLLMLPPNQIPGRAAFWSTVQEEATMDLFLAAAYHDEDFTIGLKNTLSGRGLVVGGRSSLRPRRASFPRSNVPSQGL
jgi:hypothetical protein